MNHIAKIGTAVTGALLLAAVSAHGLVVTGSVAPIDGTETFLNPGCGPAEMKADPLYWAPLSPGMSTDGWDLCSDAPNCTAFWDIGAYSKGYLYVNDNGVPLYDHYDYVTNHVGGADIPLDENTLLAVSNSLLRCRQNGGTCIPRFAYTGSEKYGCEPDDIEIMLTHVRQLAAVLSQFRDVVAAVECGMIGPWGEMHSSRYKDADSTDRVVQAWLDGLPQEMALLVRYPRIWTVRLGTTANTLFNGGGLDAIDPNLRSRMGFFNDGYLGNDRDYGTWRDGDGYWDRAQGRTFLRGQAVPYGGELATIANEYFDAEVHLFDPQRHNIVEEWYDTHLSYLRNITHDKYVINQRMKAMAFRAATWAFDGMPDLHEYEGLDLHKFCLDHMGYRYVVRGVGAEGRTNGATLNIGIENTGFGQLLFWEAHEVLLVPKAGGAPLVAEAAPSRPLASIRGGSNAVVTISFNYPKPISEGEYGVYLRVRAPLPDEIVGDAPRRPIRLANVNCYDSDLEANYLCTIAIRKFIDIFPEGGWFAYRADTCTEWGCELIDGATDDLEWRKRTFAIDDPMPRGRGARIEFDLNAASSEEFIEPDGGIASFAFREEGGEPVPYGFTADRWKRLYGRDFASGEKFTLALVLDSSANTVQFEANGLALADDTGRTTFLAAGKLEGFSNAVVLGNGRDGNIYGSLDAPCRATRLWVN